MSDYLTGTEQVIANRTKYASYFEQKDSVNEISMDTFLNLLMAEMTNQNPLEPMSNTEFVAQMAQFTSLSAMQDMVKSTNSTYAASLIGKNVTISNSTNAGAEEINGVVSAIYIKNNSYYALVDGQEYNVSSITKVGTGEKVNSETDNFNYASSLIGKYAVMQIEENGDVIYVHGKISSAEMIDGEAMIIVDEIVFPINSIVKVSNDPIEFNDNEPETEKGTESDEDKDSNEETAKAN